MRYDIRKRYENSFANVVESLGSRAFARGRHALYVALKVLGIKEGDAVGVCAYTCLSVVEAIFRTGAKCVFLDVDEWMNIDPDSYTLKKACGIKAIILQYTFGVPSHLDEMVSWAESRGIPVIEDCSHAIGSKWDGRLVGSFGVAAIFSSQWGKPYSTGQGGMLSSNNANFLKNVDSFLINNATEMSKKDDIVLEIQRWVYYSIINQDTFRLAKKAKQFLEKIKIMQGSFSEELDFKETIGYVKLAGPLLSCAGIRELEGWSKNMIIRKQNAKKILEKLKLSGIKTTILPQKADPVFLRFPLAVMNKKIILEKAEKMNIDIAGWYDSLVHPLAFDTLVKIGYENNCPKAEERVKTIVHLPTKSKTNDNSINRAIAIIENNERKNWL